MILLKIDKFFKYCSRYKNTVCV